jgi:hypothetical protein
LRVDIYREKKVGNMMKGRKIDSVEVFLENNEKVAKKID